MRVQWTKSKPLAIFVVLCGIFACVPLRSGAHAPAAAITVVNNSSREIRHVYLSPVDSDNWSADVLTGSATIAPGGSFTINNVSCDQGSIKVIAEDQNGCFLYNTTACTSDSTWTIASNATPDCGS
jgi:hypothetical protein